MKTTKQEFLDALKEHTGYWVGTTKLLDALDLPNSARPQTLMILHSLTEQGVLERHGKAKFAWRWVPNTKTAADINWKHNPASVKTGGGEGSGTTTVNNERVDQLNDLVANLETTVESLTKRLEEVAATSVREIILKNYEGQRTTRLKDVTLPKQFDQTLSLANCRRNILLVGPAGCGKTYLARLIAKSLKFSFASLSCTAGMSESHLLGRATPDIQKGTTVYQRSAFLECFEEGGVFLLDELDAADSNTLLVINDALSSGRCSVPNRPDNPVAVRHEDFVLIATANTFGRGASRVYVGRNQLDEATLDRFRIGTIECDYDRAVEASVCPDETIRVRLQTIRRSIEDASLRRILSTRFLADAYVMHKSAGWTIETILNTYFQGWSPEERAKVDIPYANSH